MIVTHSPEGEYTKHRRHEEIGQAVLKLWVEGKLDAGEVWLFAYEDGQGAYLPRPIAASDRSTKLAPWAWKKKRDIITGIYEFSTDSFEAMVTPNEEAFWCFQTRQQAQAWLRKRRIT